MAVSQAEAKVFSSSVEGTVCRGLGREGCVHVAGWDTGFVGTGCRRRPHGNAGARGRNLSINFWARGILERGE